MTDIYTRCTLCPRNCRVDRTSGEVGVCGMTDKIKAARAALHFWEEPCISGESGSGTVFFSGCPLKCVYCQNAEISHGFGEEITEDRLSDIFLELQTKKAHNINLVTPTHFAPGIVDAVERAREKGLIIPIVYNTGGYEKEDTLGMLEGVVDIFLTDLKYIECDISQRYSSAPDYADAAKKALRKMSEMQPVQIYDENGIMKKGVIVRHLVLPGRENDAKNIIKYVHERYGNTVRLSIMNQYTPIRGVVFSELEKRLDSNEYDRVVSFAGELGIYDAYIQEGDTATESFIPPFDLTGIKV